MLGELGLETKRGTEQEQRVVCRKARDRNKKYREKNRLTRQKHNRER